MVQGKASIQKRFALSPSLFFQGHRDDLRGFQECFSINNVEILSRCLYNRKKHS
ncbi:hypothetical protein E2C01_036149 [Portunus trituberculatus]|uniref:Uncharacterized protein n=1 Tax=Portunus trituberculatus TaxID=210409 RepID=A0A5B7FB38_PORTR|nr:hypothetical protein [Portunus trituberculatus]